MAEYRRILSIDGGGIKGVFPAAFLADIEETLPEPIHSYFDLIVGTSTGGIIALGLGLGFRASEILDFYGKYGPQIFGGNRFVLTLKKALWRKYSHEHLRRALVETFGGRLIGHANTRLVIPSMNIDTGEVYLFKTAHHEKFERDYKVPAVEAALATASAPTYFPLFRSSADFPLIDGGLWANNPVGVAVVEAVGVLRWPRECVKALSIGCTDEPFDVGRLRKWNVGWLWATRTVEAFMRGQSSGSLGTAYSLIGYENVVRINQSVSGGRFALDMAEGISDLCALGKNRARNESSKLKSLFFGEPAEPFMPYKEVYEDEASQ
jgi:patatin-like phospholipase/acyl hydrolase